MGLGVWWMYLLTFFARAMGPGQGHVLNMVKWEGTTFLVLLVGAGCGLGFLYWHDLRKTRALQALFASLTHELKTPLASMRLQAEVIRDMSVDEAHDHGQLEELTTRLIQDTSKFEHELDKGLQLSRVEQDAVMTLVPVDLARFIKKHASKDLLGRELILQSESQHSVVLADEMALKMVFRNLFENSLRHNPEGKRVTITLKRQADQLICRYDDHGPDFTGDRKRLGQLFYKHESRKGTGIGLYLVKQLMQAMQGRFSISEQGPLVFSLQFKAAP